MVVSISIYVFVLGLARTGLIFTRLQEGVQPGGLTQPGQKEQGIPCAVMLDSGGGQRGGGNSLLA